MKRYFEYKDEKSSKFWEITLNGKSVTTRYGKAGTDGQESEKNFADESAAEKESDKLIREKTKKGYIESESKVIGQASQKETPKQADPVRKNETTTFRMMKPKELFELYGDKINKEFRQFYDDSSEDNALVYIGDAFINGNLELADQSFGDFKSMIQPPINEEEEGYSVGAVIVLGNLEITGNLMNGSYYGPFFYVSGNLKAKNLVSGDSVMIIDGNVDVSEVTLGYYNDGSIEIGGTLTTAWLDESDHCFMVSKTKVQHKKSIGAMRKAKVFMDSIEEYDDILRELLSGNSIFVSSHSVSLEKDYKYWLAQVENNGKKLKNVPDEFIDEGICLAALDSKGEAMKHVPKRLMNEDFLLKFVARCPYRAEHIPQQHFTDNIAEAIIASKGWYLQDIPVMFITRELCMAAARNVTCMKYIPAQFMDEDLLAEVLRNNPSDIENLPRRFFSLRLMVEAAKQGHFLLPYGRRFYEFYDEIVGIPVEQISLAVMNEGFEYFDQLPGYAVTADVYKEAESRFATGLTASRWEDSKKRHGLEFWKYNGECSPEEIKKIEKNAQHEMRIGLDGFNTDYVFTKYIWNVFWEPQLFESSVRFVYTGGTQANYIKYIPKEWFTEEIAWKIIKCSRHNFKYLPDQVLDKRMCIYAIIDYGGQIGDIPKELIDEEVTLAAISKCKTEFGKSDGSGYYLKDVPYQFRTPNVCKEALKSDKRAEPHIPIEN